ncbi:hypothetical protein ASE68_04190 [Agromyces sp. Leaf222]|nr:hypothetical protein ASE68_04190 [Agromyces sp. Leaf222]
MTMQNASSTTSTERAADGASTPMRRRIGRMATLAAAVALPLLIWAGAVPIGGLDLTVGEGAAAQTVAPASIVFAVLVTGLTAWGVLALLERFSRRSGRIFALIGWPVLALSLLGPVFTGATGAALVVLFAMHVATGATLLIGLPRAARQARRPAGR